MAVIGVKVFINNTKNMNSVHKDTKDLLSVIITLGTNIRGGGTVFYEVVKTYDLVSRAHVVKHVIDRMIL